MSIIHIAEHYELRSVEDKAYSFIAEHLNELVKTEELQVGSNKIYFRHGMLRYRKQTHGNAILLEIESEQHVISSGFLHAEKRIRARVVRGS